jgi:hypothetical protein
VLTGGDLLGAQDGARRLDRPSGEMGGVVVAHESPPVASGRDELGQRCVRRLQFERAVGGQAQQPPERGVDDTSVACHNDRTSAVFVHDA